MSLFDERFLTHRLRATSIAGIAGGILAVVLWFRHYVFEHRWSWELLAIPLTMATVKQGLLLWYRFRD